VNTPLLENSESKLASAGASSSLVLMFERLATNPDVDVAKLERLIEMQERIMRHNAKSAFDSSFSRMQSEMPEVDERGQIIVRGQLRSTYAKLEDIHKAIKPILKAHGFAIRHRTEWPADKPNIIRIVGILSHEQGHAEESVFEAPMDKSDYRTDIQSMGSTISFGRRYSTLDLLNITTRGLDDDGQGSERPQAPEPPAKFAEWWLDMAAVADTGWDAYKRAWNEASQEFRNYVAKHHQSENEALKKKATAVSAAQKAEAKR
jgi:hypothetical protein